MGNNQQTLENRVINDMASKIGILEGNLSIANAKINMLQEEINRLNEELAKVNEDRDSSDHNE